MSLAVFVFGGAVLIVAGVLQVLVRPRPSEGGGSRAAAGGAVVRAVIFVVMGLLAVLVGLGVIPFARI